MIISEGFNTKSTDNMETKTCFESSVGYILLYVLLAFVMSALKTAECLGDSFCDQQTM